MKKSLILTLILLIFLMQVNAKETLDIQAELVETEILPDDPLRFQVSVFRVGERREDIHFQYFIGDRFIKSESIAVEKIGSFFRTIELPGNVKMGSNKLLIKATIGQTEAEATQNFNIIRSSEYIELPIKYINYFFLLLFIILVIFTILIIWDYRLNYKLMKIYDKIAERDLEVKS